MYLMSRITIAATIVGLATACQSVNAQPNADEHSCQAALAGVAKEWTEVGLPAAPEGPLGGIQAKNSAVVRGANGYVTSLANFQYMTIELHAATRACQSGDSQTAMEKVAVLRDRLGQPVHAAE